MFCSIILFYYKIASTHTLNAPPWLQRDAWLETCHHALHEKKDLPPPGRRFRSHVKKEKEKKKRWSVLR